MSAGVDHHQRMRAQWSAARLVLAVMVIAPRAQDHDAVIRLLKQPRKSYFPAWLVLAEVCYMRAGSSTGSAVNSTPGKPYRQP